VVGDFWFCVVEGSGREHELLPLVGQVLIFFATTHEYRCAGSDKDDGEKMLFHKLKFEL
jgi:hypothetical protein